MKDGNLRRCSHAARGVWIDLICLMFDSPQRGKLVTERCDKGVTSTVTWTLQDCADSLQGDRDTNMRLIEELISKGVMKQDEHGVYYSKRLISDEEKRTCDRNRQRKRRGLSRNCHATVTVDVTRLSEDENESERHGVVSSYLEEKPENEKSSSRNSHADVTDIPEDSDELMQSIFEAHPRPEKPHETFRSIIEQVETHLLVKFKTARAALLYLLERTKLYADKTRSWPKDQRKYIRMSVTFFAEGCYKEDESQWEWQYGNESESKGQKRNSNNAVTFGNAVGLVNSLNRATNGAKGAPAGNANRTRSNETTGSKVSSDVSGGSHTPQARNDGDRNPATNPREPEIIPPRKD